MKRRTFVKGLAGLLGVGGTVVAGLKLPRITEFGASPPEFIKPDAKHFYATFAPFKGISEDLDRNVLLYNYLKDEIGPIIPHYQGPAPDGSPGEGDCVGQAAAMGCDILAAVNIHMLRQREKFIGKASVEMLYAGGRVEIGGLGGGQLRGRGGSHGEWMARFLNEYGVLHQTQYSYNGNTLDLSGYHPDRSRKYRDEGVPDWLEQFAREHPVKEVTNVLNANEAVDAICAGQPILVCSSYAFSDTRDKDGFAKMYKGRMRPQWWHAMLASGAILAGGRKGVVIQNSHGIWNSGPQPHGIPDGGFAVDLEDFDLMIQDWFDCYALSAYHGHDASKIRHRLYWG